VNSRLALGTVQFGLQYGVANKAGRVPADEVAEILRVAKDRGINTLDTAVVYGDSEQILGQAGVTNWQVVSKLPELPDDVENVTAWVENQVENILQRLELSQLYGLLLHRPQQLLEARGKLLIKALEETRAQARATKIGVSVYSPTELEPLFDVMHLDLVQMPFNILDRRLIESGWARQLKSSDVEIHVRSVFLQGLLLMTDRQRPAKFEKWSSLWAEWSRWLGETGLSPLEACLRFVLNVDDIDKVIIGVDGVDHLCEILEVNCGPLDTLPDWPKSVDPMLLNPACWSEI
jgi:hypothetical protein